VVLLEYAVTCASMALNDQLWLRPPILEQRVETTQGRGRREVFKQVTVYLNAAAEELLGADGRGRRNSPR
jgi:hypothetical protein